MSQKIIISKPTYNILTETNPDNLIFSSDYNTLKYYINGSTSITIIGDGTDKYSETTIAHNLGYVPFFIVYVDDFVNASAYYNIVPSFNNTLFIFREAHAYANTSNLYIRMRNKSTYTYTANFYYKIYRNNLGL